MYNGRAARPGKAALWAVGLLGLAGVYMVGTGQVTPLLTPAVPTVSVSFRHSLVGNGLVAVVRNTGSKPLYDIKVSCGEWKDKYRVAGELKPGQVTEAGWLELKEGLRAGQMLEVYAAGYPAPAWVSVQPPPDR